jgi:hypothetical protein
MGAMMDDAWWYLLLFLKGVMEKTVEVLGFVSPIIIFSCVPRAVPRQFSK